MLSECFLEGALGSAPESAQQRSGVPQGVLLKVGFPWERLREKKKLSGALLGTPNLQGALGSTLPKALSGRLQKHSDSTCWSIPHETHL